jgi:ligand-binding SRPBCC domain-containing protein
MARIELTTRIAAPPGRCFDLARSVDVHLRSAASTGERVVAGRSSGLLRPGDEVTWQARHFGIVLRLASRITAFDPPNHFRDTMVRGPLQKLDHDHCFTDEGAGATSMRDVFEYSAPVAGLGRLAEILFLNRHFRRFLAARNEELRFVAESDAWRQFVPGKIDSQDEVRASARDAGSGN